MKELVIFRDLKKYFPGEIIFKGENIGYKLSKRRKSIKGEIQMVFQDPGTTLNPRKQVKEILALPLRVHGTNKKDVVPRIKELLEAVELPDNYIYKYPHELGGGEKQTVAIARALAVNPSLIILDEPTSALDVSIQAKILNLLFKTQEMFKLTYLFITHDLSMVRNISNQVAIMYLGKICEIAPTAFFFQDPLHPYTKMLLSSIPVITDAEERIKPNKVKPEGEIPSPVNIPPGCSFHSRCRNRMDICSKVDPSFIEVNDGHIVRCHLFS